MNPCDPDPPFDPVAFMLGEVCDVLTSPRWKAVRAKNEVRYSIDFDWRPPWVMDLRWRADPGALGVSAKVSGLPKAGRSTAEIQAGFDEAAKRKRGVLEDPERAQSADAAESIMAEAKLAPVGPSINADGHVCYEIVVELLARDLTRALIVAMLNNAVNVLIHSIWCADLSEPIHES